jgi:hypothetical protein
MLDLGLQFAVMELGDPAAEDSASTSIIGWPTGCAKRASTFSNA